jgi:hypothetical protein
MSQYREATVWQCDRSVTCHMWQPADTAPFRAPATAPARAAARGARTYRGSSPRIALGRDPLKRASAYEADMQTSQPS